MLADAARTYAIRYAARPGSRAVVVTAHDGAYRAAMELAASGVEIAAIADVRPLPGRSAAGSRSGGRAADQGGDDGDRHAGKAARIGGGAVATQVGRLRRRIRNDRMRSRADVRRHDAERAAVLAVARQAALGRHAARLMFRAHRPNGSDRPARAGGSSVCTPHCPTATRRAKPPRWRPDAARARRAHSPCRRSSRRKAACRRVAGCAPRKAAGLRRFPERRHDQGSGARGARRLPLGRARQALHHDRHGDRSGQDLEHERARRPRRRSPARPIPEIGLTTSRNPYTPVTFGTLAGLARRRSVRSGAAHADPRLGRGARRGLRGCRVMEARALFPARRRDHARRRETRMRGGAPALSACSTPRRSARSRSSAATPPSFSTACTSIR